MIFDEFSVRWKLDEAMWEEWQSFSLVKYLYSADVEWVFDTLRSSIMAKIGRLAASVNYSQARERMYTGEWYINFVSASDPLINGWKTMDFGVVSFVESISLPYRSIWR